MLERPEEYEIMDAAEADHWWYCSLHESCLRALQQWKTTKAIKVLDAGCGTGGLMIYLRDQGYSNIAGFDLSEIAVEKCLRKSLNVWQQDIKSLAECCDLAGGYDVVICNDILCYLTDVELKIFFTNIALLLNEDGTILINVPALRAFSGLHDLAVGIKQRFARKDYDKYIDAKQLKILSTRYWPFLLSPLIYLIRSYQRIKLRLFKIKKIESDIKQSNWLVNSVLFKICQFEIKYLPTCVPFGSSLFLIIQKIRQP